MTTMQADTLTTPESGRSRASRLPAFALGGICLLAAVLYGWGIGDSWGNTYYSAAVKSMSQSFENFFFGAFDPAGVLTVDKPPMSMWIQTLSVKVFGFNGFAVLLPQVLAGVAAVFLLHRTVRRWAGEHAALVAALVMTLTPITVAINRNNNPDTLLVLLAVAGAYAVTRAIEGKAATRWLMLGALLVGCGFITKMLQAWMVLPAFILAYLIGRNASWGRRFAELSAAAAVLLFGSFWWVIATMLWPDPKPYVGGSMDGSAWDLVFGYNGFGRIFGSEEGGGGGAGAAFAGPPGVGRLFNEQLAGQITWLLPMCALVLLAVLVVAVRGERMPRAEAAGWTLWGGWLLVLVVMFSFAKGTMHPYYTTMLAPAVGAVSGVGLMLFWRWYREPGNKGRLMLPVSVGVTTVWAVVLVLRNPEWHGWAAAVAGVLGVGAILASLVPGSALRNSALRNSALRDSGWGINGRAVLVVGLMAILAVPATWSAASTFGRESIMDSVNPMAGPEVGMGDPSGQPPDDPQSDGPMTVGGPGSKGPDGPGGPAGDQQPGGQPQDADGPSSTSGWDRSELSSDSLSAEQRQLLDYITARAGNLYIPLAVEGGASTTATFIINSDLTAIRMGGFQGTDNSPSLQQLTAWQRSGVLGFVMLDQEAEEDPGGGGELSQRRAEWVTKHCELVEPAAYGGSEGGRQPLYTCG